MNLTDNEIKKAMECCGNGLCTDCPRLVTPYPILSCKEQLIKSALDLNNRQQAEIEKFKKIETTVNGFWEGIQKLAMFKDKEIPTLEELLEYMDNLKVEAIKEFAERFLKIVHDNHYLLVDRINSKDYGMFTIGIEQAVDETKKEMVGDTE